MARRIDCRPAPNASDTRNWGDRCGGEKRRAYSGPSAATFMLFSEPPFLFFFLPAVLLAYFALGPRLRDLVLLGSSLIFYAWGEYAYVVVLLASILLNWACGLAAAPGRSETRARRAQTLAIVGNLTLLVGFKYTNFIVDNINGALTLLGLPPIHIGHVHLPIGISFFAFQGLSYVIDVHRGTVAPQRSLIKLGMYKAFFPQLIAGPIVRYVDVKPQIEHRELTLDDFALGARRFIIGLGKKMIIANTVARPTDEILALTHQQYTPSLAWIAIVGYTLQIYFDFSAYSDMAIGLGRMFGFRFLENFNYPYIATSMTDFWRRWHISLSTWFRDYLYIPLGGNRVGPARRYLNLMTVFLFCGLWHGASWNFAIWGLLHGTFLILERLRCFDPIRGAWRPVRHAYVVLTVIVSWVFFRAESLPAAFVWLRAMVGMVHPADGTPSAWMFIDRETVLTTLLAIVGATPILPALARRVDRLKWRLPSFESSLEAAQLLALAGVFAYSVMLMAAGSYSPFIYFRF